jgi:hypothetical protein
MRCRCCAFAVEEIFVSAADYTPFYDTWLFTIFAIYWNA